MELSTAFSDRRVFLPVVHVEDASQAMRNVQVARDNGAHGVFLINHRINAWDLLGIYHGVRAKHPDWWIGLNMLDLEPWRVFIAAKPNVSGLWFDHSGIDLTAQDPVREAREMMRAHDRRPYFWRGVHFGGVAFKYQAQSGDPAEEARLAMPFMDVITTSGDQTGKPPSLDKIRAIRAAIGSKPLAIASGITPENVDSFLPYVDCFLVATGISFSHTELDPARVRMLADLIRAW